MQFQFNSTTHGQLIKLIKESNAIVQVYTSMGYVQVNRASILRTLRKYSASSTVFYNKSEEKRIVISLK